MCKTRAWNPCLGLPLQPLETEMKKKEKKGDSLAVPWLGLCEDLGSISGQGTKIPQATWYGQKRKKKRQKCLPPNTAVNVLNLPAHSGDN